MWIPAGKTNIKVLPVTLTPFSTYVKFLLASKELALSRGDKPWDKIKQWWEGLPDMSFKIDVDEGAFSFSADGVIRVEKGGIERAGGAYDVITANLSAALLRRLSSHIAQHLRPRGSLIISGILDDEEVDVVAAYTQCGLKVEKVMNKEGWVAILLKRC